jgi:hypothetical protein
LKLKCVFCSGGGRNLSSLNEKCPVCNAKGEVTLVGEPELILCTFCSGGGRDLSWLEDRCPICQGIGYLTTDREPLIIATHGRTLSPPQEDASTQDRFFPTGSTHDAYVHIRSLLQSAKKEAFIIDPYMDTTIYSTLATVTANPLAIRIITSRVPSDFGLEGKKFAAQRPHVSLELRQAKDFHDRFIFIDRTSGYALGLSIKDAGGRSCAIIQISELAGVILAHAESIWATATPL